MSGSDPPHCSRYGTMSRLSPRKRERRAESTPDSEVQLELLRGAPSAYAPEGGRKRRARGSGGDPTLVSIQAADSLESPRGRSDSAVYSQFMSTMEGETARASDSAVKMPSSFGSGRARVDGVDPDFLSRTVTAALQGLHSGPHDLVRPHCCTRNPRGSGGYPCCQPCHVVTGQQSPDHPADRGDWMVVEPHRPTSP